MTVYNRNIVLFFILCITYLRFVVAVIIIHHNHLNEKVYLYKKPINIMLPDIKITLTMPQIEQPKRNGWKDI